MLLKKLGLTTFAGAVVKGKPSQDRWTGALLALPLIVYLTSFVVWPLGRLVAQVLTPTGLGALKSVLIAGRYRTSLVNSLGLSALASATALAFALVPSWILARERFWGRDVLRMALSLPLSFSGVLFGFLMVVMLGRAGVIPKLLGVLTGREFFSGWAYSLVGLFLAYLYFEIPRAVMTLESAFRRFPAELDWAAHTLGAGSLMRLRRVIFPVFAPAFRSTFAVTLVMTIALGTNTLAMVMMFALSRKMGNASPS